MKPTRGFDMLHGNTLPATGGNFAPATRPKAFDVVLCDIQAPIVQAWRSAFAPYPEVEIVQGSLLDVVADAYVSPTNSFGVMDGGIDTVLQARFPRVELLVQHAIAAQGEPLAVGECIIVETGDFDVPYLACAPTMLFPSTVADTDHAFQAMRAILLAVGSFNAEGGRIGSLAIPGLCTGVGQMPPEVAAAQMAEAYRMWLRKAGSVGLPG